MQQKIKLSLLLFAGLISSLIQFNCYADHSTENSAKNELVMGIFPRRNAKITIKLFKPMAKYLETQLGHKIRLVTSKNFETFWQGIENQQYDIVHYNQYHYVVSHSRQGYQVILKNNEFGESTIAGSLIVRADSGINHVQDLKGKKIVFGGGPKAMQSYIVTTFLLRNGGLNPGDYQEEFAKNPPNAIFSSYHKQSDAAGAGDKVLKLGMVKKRIDVNQMKYLIRGEQLPHLPWAVKQGMEPKLIQQVQKLMSNLDQSEEGKNVLKSAHLTGIELANDSEYDKHREIIHSVYPQLEF